MLASHLLSCGVEAVETLDWKAKHSCGGADRRARTRPAGRSNHPHKPVLITEATSSLNDSRRQDSTRRLRPRRWLPHNAHALLLLLLAARIDRSPLPLPSHLPLCPDWSRFYEAAPRALMLPLPVPGTARRTASTKQPSKAGRGGRARAVLVQRG